MDSKGSKMPVSESDKMEASVLGCRLGEKIEYLPIKKRRFLFRNSSPPNNTSLPEESESVSACLNSVSQEVNPKPKANCPPAASFTVANLHQSGSNDHFEGSGIVSNHIKSLEAPGTVEFKVNSVKMENMSATADNSAQNESALDDSCSHAPSESECSEMNQGTSNTQKSAALDDRLNWDLNTVMAWEEPLESDHNMNSCKEGKSEHCENIGTEILPVELKSLIPKTEESELEDCKLDCNGISKLLSPVINSAVPSALTLEYPVCEISSKNMNVKAAGTDCTFMPPIFDHGIDICASEKNVVSSKIVGSGSNINHANASVQTTENEKLNLSLVTAPSIENGNQKNGSTFEEDDKASVKRVITSNGIAMGNLISKGTESSQNVLFSSKSVGSGDYFNHVMTAVQTTENEKLNLSLVTASSTEIVVPQSGNTFDDEDDKAKVKRVITINGITMENPPTAVSSMHDVVCSGAEVPNKSGKLHTDFPNDIKSYNKEVCDYENFPSDIQAGSEVDNVDELSFGYDSQFEDGEFRESSIQTWEGNEGEDREIDHGTENGGDFGTHENCSLRSTEIGSQKAADEISSVVLPEKLESSDQISGSEPNMTENCLTEVNMKDASQSDQWKMNVSGSDILPENYSSSSNISKIKDFSSIKSYSRINEDLETKAEGSRFYRRELSTREAFISRTRFRMQGSSSKGDDSASKSVRDSGVGRSIGRGKYTRGGVRWDRSPSFPGPSFLRALPEDVDNLTNKVGVDPNVTHGSFRNRLMVNSEEDEFRARLGLRPSGDTCHNRFVNVGRGRSLRYGSRHNDVGPRGRYYGHPANHEPSMEYSHSFPARPRCFSPTHHHSGSTSPPRSRTRSPISEGFRRRSRSPNLRSDRRMRRPRSPNYRHGFEADHVGGYNLEQSRNNNSPPSSRFVKYKQQSFLFDRRSPPPPPPIGERLSFYDNSRKTKQNENYRSSRFSELHGGGRDGDVMDHGYRRGAFARPYDMGRPVKHLQYDEEDGYGPTYDSRDKDGLEFHGRLNPKPYGSGIDIRFRDLPRRPREDRDNW